MSKFTRTRDTAGSPSPPRPAFVHIVMNCTVPVPPHIGRHVIWSLWAMTWCRFPPVARLKGNLYLGSSHVAGQSGGKTASEPGTALMGRLDRGQPHRWKPQEESPNQWCYIIRCLKQGKIMASSLVICLALMCKTGYLFNCGFVLVFTRCHVSIQICRVENIYWNKWRTL